MKHADSEWWVYICAKDDRLYVGITTDLKKRLKQHAGSELVYREGPLSQTKAATREKQIKKWRREKKRLLIGGMPGKSK